MRTVCFFTETPVSSLQTAYSTTIVYARSQTNPFPRLTRTRFQTAKTPENDINLVVDGVLMECLLGTVCPLTYRRVFHWRLVQQQSRHLYHRWTNSGGLRASGSACRTREACAPVTGYSWPRQSGAPCAVRHYGESSVGTRIIDGRCLW